MKHPDDYGPPLFDSVQDLARFFRVGESSVRRAIKSEQIRAIRIGGQVRIPRTERERLMASVAN